MKIHVHDHTPTINTITADSAETHIKDLVSHSGDEQLWAEDEDEPLASSATVASLGDSRTSHIHRGRGLISVEVSYNGDDRVRDFGPGSTIDRVFQWAIGPAGFAVDPTAALDLVLRLPATESDLDPGIHIGTLAGKDKRLQLDLLPARRFAG